MTCTHTPPLPQRECCAADPGTDPQVLVQLAVDVDLFVRAAVGENVTTPPAVLAQLGRPGENYLVVMAVAGNTATPVDVLTDLAGDLDERIRTAVATNPSTPPGLLERLARDRGYDVRDKVAANPSTPGEVLRWLTRDDSAWVRVTVARNPRLPVDVLELLSASDDHQVRASVAYNPSTPAACLGLLADDPIDDVRAMVAGNPKTPAVALARLAGDIWHVRLTLAGNRATQVSVLGALAEDGDDSVQTAVAGNPVTPPEVLLGLPANLVYQAGRWDEVTADAGDIVVEVARTLAADGATVPAGELLESARRLAGR